MQDSSLLLLCTLQEPHYCRTRREAITNVSTRRILARCPNTLSNGSLNVYLSLWYSLFRLRKGSPVQMMAVLGVQETLLDRYRCPSRGLSEADSDYSDIEETAELPSEMRLFHMGLLQSDLILIDVSR